jgi:hypothetical protein
MSAALCLMAVFIISRGYTELVFSVPSKRSSIAMIWVFPSKNKTLNVSFEIAHGVVEVVKDLF